MSAKGKKTPKAVAEHQWTVLVDGPGVPPEKLTITAATAEGGPVGTSLRDARGDVVFTSPLVRYARRERIAPEPVTVMLPFRVPDLSLINKALEAAGANVRLGTEFYDRHAE